MRRAALVCGGLYVAMCALLYVFQQSLMYFPPSAPVGPVVDFQGHAVSMRGLRSPQALLYFGGNAEDVAANLPEYAAAFPEHAIYLAHYRGFGGAPGTPDEEGLTEDALALFDRVWEKHAQVTVVGRSLGSGLALRVASEKQVARLVLITPFDSMEDVAERRLPFVPVRWLLRDKYLSSKYAAGVSVPVLVISAERDEVVPRESTELLMARFARGVARQVVVARAGHNTIAESKLFWAYLQRGVMGED
jgi:pimeloyl-ACP methyl ester carboxylesterase